MDRPSVEDLRILLAVVRNGGDAAAARVELGMEQPKMSKRMDWFKTAGGWLRLDGRTWRLTPAGERALPGVRDVVRRYELLTAGPAADPSGPGVVFGCGQTAAGSYVLAAAAAFRADHPGVRLRVRTPRSRVRVEELAAGSLDLAAVSHAPDVARRIAGRPLASWPLTEEPLVAAAGRTTAWGKALAAEPADVPLSAAALVGLGGPLLLPEPTAGVRAAIDRAVGEAAVAVEAGGWGVLAGYARAGFGVAVGSRAGLTGAGLVARLLDPAAFPPVRTWLVARRAGSRADLTPEGEAFRRAVLAAAQRPAG